MGKQAKLRQTGSRLIVIDDAPSPSSQDEILLGREVTGNSIDRINQATQIAKGRRVERVLAGFIFPILYEHQLERARAASPHGASLSARELADELRGLPIDSLHEPVTANVRGVNPHAGDLGVQVDYVEHAHEIYELENAIRGSLSLPQDYELSLGSQAGIIVVHGVPRSHQIEAMRNDMPEMLILSPVLPE